MALAAAALAVLAAAAAPGLAAAKKGAGGDDDPNREVCKSRPVIGSRVQRVRECHSAEQWAEMELQERMGLMRKQINGDPGCNGDPAVNPCGVRNGGRDTPW
jgi:hypothetical protein